MRARWRLPPARKGEQVNRLADQLVAERNVRIDRAEEIMRDVESIIKYGTGREIIPFIEDPTGPVGLVGYGAYVPRYRLPAVEVARVWAGGKTGGLPIKEKAVAGHGRRCDHHVDRSGAQRAGPRADLSRSCCARSGLAPNRTPTR